MPLLSQTFAPIGAATSCRQRRRRLVPPTATRAARPLGRLWGINQPIEAAFSRGCQFGNGGLDELHFSKALPVRTVKENAVAIRFPDRRNPNLPRTVQAEMDAARLAPAHENLLGHRERTALEMSVVAKGCVNIVT